MRWLQNWLHQGKKPADYAESGLIIPTRRQFMQGGLALLCAPAIVRFSSLMPVKAPPLILPPDYSSVLFDPTKIVAEDGSAVFRTSPALQWAIDDARRKNWNLLMRGEHPTQIAFRKLEEERWNERRRLIG